jgi:hypothetical protein
MELVQEFHEKYPEKLKDPQFRPTLIRRINYNGWDDRLFHPWDRTHGSDFTIPKTPESNLDWIIPVPESSGKPFRNDIP